MRIVIDLQGAQGQSRNRGIGRYSMAITKAIIRNKGQHEILVALNGRFSESIEFIKKELVSILPEENIRVWIPPAHVRYLDSGNIWRRRSAELMREAFLVSLAPDIVYITSLFEGFGDDIVCSIGTFLKDVPTAVTLYDLIPLIHRRPYLENPDIELWYENKIGHLLRSDLLLAISESSKNEAINYLGFVDDEVKSIGTAADAHFRKRILSDQDERKLRSRYGLHRQFIMYTGGIDHRKNIEGLIRAFSLLDSELRKKFQLSIVCSVSPESRNALEEEIAKAGLSTKDVILTGFVSEEDLVALYNICYLFVFPSWHEGFGLPILEAMSCGAPVIGSNTSSLPEVIGREDALFNPLDDLSIANKISQVLNNTDFRDLLIAHSFEQSKNFSWDKSARTALVALEEAYLKHSKQKSKTIHRRRLKLAYVSPLPPKKSGISDYSAELLPELSRHYDIDVIVAQESVNNAWIRANCAIRDYKWFLGNSHLYDRVLYHFGNSEFHQHMFDLLNKVPGVVVLHDFFLSGVLAFMEATGYAKNCWVDELFESHGEAASKERFLCEDTTDTIYKYPCSKSIFKASHGVIVHSNSSVKLAKKWYGSKIADEITVVPLLRTPAHFERNSARISENIKASDFIICSFGFLGSTKLNHRLINAWLTSDLFKDPNCKLIFVGENPQSEYGKMMQELVDSSQCEDRIRITGWTSLQEFKKYLSIADVAVQLRANSRGETSAAVLDCMNYGVPTIVNANGAMADLPHDAVFMLPDEFTDQELANAIEELRRNQSKRRAIGARAREVITYHHSPRKCADQYYNAIELYFAKSEERVGGLIKAIGKVDSDSNDVHDIAQIADLISKNFLV